jgi:hypothetical protein
MIGRLRGLFTEHPASVGETYVQHLVAACGFAVSMVVGGLACLAHAVLPFIFVTTASRTVARLHDRMIKNRARVSSGLPDSTSRS